MLGLTSLFNELKGLFKNSNAIQKQHYSIALSDLFQWENSKDYLFTFFHQNDMRFIVSILKINNQNQPFE